MNDRYHIFAASLLVFIFVWGAPALRAQQLSNCPPSPYPVTVKQGDGSALTIVGRGGMLKPWTETLDGYTVVKKNDVYQYAIKKAGRLVPSGMPARNVGERKPAEASFLRQVPKAVKPDLPAIPGQAPFGATVPQAAGPQQVGYPSTGKVKALLLLIRYPDLANTNSPADFQKLMNQPNYRGTGSFKDFFLASSFGQLNVTTDVQGWYTAAHPYKYYGWEHGAGRSTELVREAVDAAEKAGVDFSQYDNDGDGAVDGIIVAHAGPGAEEGSQLQYVWSHRFVLSGAGNQVSYDGVFINDYIMNPERRQFTGQMVGIGVYCHEFGHNLGLPDLYDTDDFDGRSEGLGEWSLMASAGWLGGEHSPGNMCAWSRNELNWLRPTVLKARGSYALPAASGSNQVFRINTALPNEYYLLENRQKTGLDVALNGSGLAIFHVNTHRWNNSDETMKMVDLEEADGLNHLDHASNRGDDGDLYPGASNNTAFNDTSNPNSKTYTDARTNISISNITIDETGTALFQVSLEAELALTSFAPGSAPVGAGVAIRGSQLVDVLAVRFNGISAKEIYPAGPTLLYATVPAGATTGPIEIVARDDSVTSTGDFVVAPPPSAWNTRRALAQARSQHGAVAAGGNIFTFGGHQDKDLLTSLEIYDPKTNTWQAGAPMPKANQELAFASGPDDHIYVIGSHGSGSDATTNAFSYNPRNNKWKKLASIPGSAWEGAAAASTKEKVYVFGGRSFGGSTSPATRVYDIRTNTWEAAADIPVAVMQHRAITAEDGRIYVIGGRTSPDAGPAGLVQIYDPATDTWSAGADMPIPKVAFGAVLAQNDLIYVAGGKATYAPNQGPFFHTVEVYNPATDTWSAAPAMPVPLGELTLGSVNGNLFAQGGSNGSSRNFNFRLILAPVAPASLSAKPMSATSISLKWKDIAGNETGFTLERATKPDGLFSVVTTRSANKTSYTDTGLSPNSTYYYRIKARSAGGNSPYSNIASAKTTKAEIIALARQQDAQPPAVNSLQVGPNPAPDRTQVAFQVNSDQEVLVEIYDEKGKQVARIFQGFATGGEGYQFEWHASALPSGIYICRLVTKKETLYQRILLTR